ncbi:hypothetical protein DO97_03750 [Neosynechococcus sphagnicola sy1]|uniref:CopG family transcriptional regulator n=1 Tax=Neosynechococcus sphagnicola sy1 TaxID=1497020 RepID=A0A098TKP0_9CYAN|nr:hypothetical protein [Neosynechococcus sphagnicola]KGF72851.1 hypothetical protein DO97_03750 [Neosynechococcus sphagnicola sy1]
MAKTAIAAKIPSEWKQSIDEMCQLLGITPSKWVEGVIGEALKRDNPDTVRSLDKRLTAQIEELRSELGEFSA